MIQTADRHDLDVPAPAGHDAIAPQPGEQQARPTPRAASPTIHDPTGTTGTARFLVGARLPITIAVCANTPALATGYATTRTVTTLRRIPAVFLRGRTPPVRSTHHPHQESVTATRILRQVPNPGLPHQPVYTIAATVLLGVRVEAPNRAAAWRRAHDLPRGGHRRAAHRHPARAHRGAGHPSVRRAGPTPTGQAPRRQPAPWPAAHPSGRDGQPHAA